MFTPPKAGIRLQVTTVGEANQLEENIKKMLDSDKKRMFCSFLR
jgi:hypothetical protein